MQPFLQSFLQPPKAFLSPYDLGPASFKLNDISIRREEHIVKGIPFSVFHTFQNHPCVLYIHSYNSNRIEVRTILKGLLSKGFNVVSIELQRISFDEGQRQPKINKNGIITFGYYEHEQIHYVMKWIKANISDRVILWGRSMGAVCAIRYQNFYGSASELVLDSPFHNLIQLFSTKLYEISILPQFLAKGSVQFMKTTLSEKLHFNIEDLSIEKDLNFSTPITLLFNKNDSVSNLSSEIIYKKFPGKKQIYYLEAPHEAQRELSVMKKVVEKLSSTYFSQIKLKKKKTMKSSNVSKTVMKPLMMAETTIEIEEEDTKGIMVTMNSRERSFLERSCLF